MNAKQERFCIEYLKTGNSRQAYKNAGYAVKNDNSADTGASRLLSSAKVQTRIKELTDKTRNEAIADIQEIMERLTAIVRGLEVEEVIVTEMIGHGMSKASVMHRKPSIHDILKACEILAKMQGGFDRTMTVQIETPIFSGEENMK